MQAQKPRCSGEEVTLQHAEMRRRRHTVEMLTWPEPQWILEPTPHLPLRAGGHGGGGTDTEVATRLPQKCLSLRLLCRRSNLSGQRQDHKQVTQREVLKVG